MHKIKMVFGRIITISVIGAILDLILHAILAPTYNYDYPPSYFVESGLFRPVAGIYLLIIFILLGLVFILIEGNLPGTKFSKGLRFGISFGGLWFLGVMGMSIFYGSPLLHEVLGGACDCASLISLGVLLGVYTGTDCACSSDKNPMRMISAIILIAFFFIIGQYLAFILMSEIPYLNISGLDTFVWTAILGFWSGVVYWLLREGIDKEISPIKRSIFFGGVIIGIDWVLFNLFVLLFVDAPVLDPIILAVLNIVSIIVGIFVFETLFPGRAGRYSKMIMAFHSILVLERFSAKPKFLCNMDKLKKRWKIIGIYRHV